MKRKTRTFTPIDLFVQTYAMDHPRKYEYHPGDSVSFKSSMMVSEEIEELLDAVALHGLSVHFEGDLVIWEHTESDEDKEPEAREEPDSQPEPTLEEIEEIERESDRIAEEMKELEPVVEETEEGAIEIEVDEETEEEIIEI